MQEVKYHNHIKLKNKITATQFHNVEDSLQIEQFTDSIFFFFFKHQNNFDVEQKIQIHQELTFFSLGSTVVGSGSCMKTKEISEMSLGSVLISQ